MRLPDKRLNELLALGVGRVGPNDITAYDLIALVEEAIASRDRLERAEKALTLIGAGRPMSVGPPELMLDEWMDLAEFRRKTALARDEETGT